jgi:pSer/pThr/pTyr-binding forkhead associated (FHA) protein
MPTPPAGIQQVSSHPPAPVNVAANAPANAFGATAFSDAPPPSLRAPAARPAAPPFDFGPRGSGPPSPSPALPLRAACGRCGAWNDAGIRFCVTCGNGLGAPPPQAAPFAQVAQGQAPLGPAPTSPVALDPARAFAAIAPGRVVPVTPPPPPREEARVCGRCRGACDPGATFCRFCGAPLGAPAPAAAPTARDATARPPPLATDPLPPPQNRSAPATDFTATPAHDTSHFQGAPGTYGATAATDLSPRARLVVIGKDGSEGASHPIGESIDVGRTEGHVVMEDDRYLSPRHARVVRKGAPGAVRLWLRDLGSTNGVYLRLRPTPPGATAAAPAVGPSTPSTNADPGGLSLAHPLRDQDLFLVGQQVLRFEVVNDADDGLGPASQHGTLLFGCPASPRYARLSQRTVEGVTRDVFYIRKAETVLGRESGDIVFTEDPFLSRRHAAVRLEKEPRRFLLTDLGSSNGTFIQIRGEVALEPGDQFRIGQQLFRVDIS